MKYDMDGIDYVRDNRLRNWHLQPVVEMPEVPQVNPEAFTCREVPALPFYFTREQEAYIFLSYNYAKMQLVRLRKQGIKSGPKVANFWDQMAKLEDTIARAYMPLALSFIKKRMRGGEYGDMVSDTLPVMIRSIRKFDVGKGFRFSTYMCNALFKQLSRAWKDHCKHLAYQYDTEMPMAIDQDPVGSSMADTEAVLKLREIVNSDLLDSRMRKIVKRRLAPRRGPKLTLDELGEKMGITKERVRQIEMKTIKILREALAPTMGLE